MKPQVARRTPYTDFVDGREFLFSLCGECGDFEKRQKVIHFSKEDLRKWKNLPNYSGLPTFSFFLKILCFVALSAILATISPSDMMLFIIVGIIMSLLGIVFGFLMADNEDKNDLQKAKKSIWSHYIGSIPKGEGIHPFGTSGDWNGFVILPKG